MTAAAPCARRAVACSRIVPASGATDRPPTFEAIVAVNAPRVITPMIPTLTPAAWTRTAGFTLAHSTARPLAASTRFAARNGNAASDARAFSAPLGSSAGEREVAAGPTGPKSNSWLPIAAAV